MDFILSRAELLQVRYWKPTSIIYRLRHTGRDITKMTKNVKRSLYSAICFLLTGYWVASILLEGRHWSTVDTVVFVIQMPLVFWFWTLTE